MATTRMRFCLAAIKTLDTRDLDDLTARIETYQKAGMAPDQAQTEALNDLRGQVILEQSEIVNVLREQRPELFAAAAPEAPAAAPTAPAESEMVKASAQLAGRVSARLKGGHAMDWRSLFAMADEAFGGTQAEGKYSPKDAYDAMELGVNQYLLERAPLVATSLHADDAVRVVNTLEGLVKLLPTQTKRTAEQDQFQQFSTPPAFSYAANWVANPSARDTYLESSAGLGGLAVFGQNTGATLVLNELAPRRADLLQSLFPGATVMREDGEQMNNVMPAGVVPTVAVINPPFSSSGTRGVTKDTMIGARHVEQALKALAPGGRLVAIVGNGMELGKPSFADWWKKIQAKYDVRAVIPVEGAGYVKYGTTFGNALLVIDKIPPQARAIVTTRADAYTDLIGLLAGIRDDRPTASTPNVDRGAQRPAAVEAGAGAVRPSAATPGARVGADESGAVLGGEQPGATGVGGVGGGSAVAGAVGGPAGAALESPEPGAGAGDLFAGLGASDAAPAGGPDSAGHATSVSIDEPVAELSDSVFEAYKPQRLQIPGAREHPGELVQSAAMASVLPPKATYTPNLPKATITKGLLSLAQLESVVYAGQAHAQVLPNGERRGFFIGDGTGVGKGREIGGIILDNLRQGRTKAVWITEKQGLINDAKRDFEGVGGDPTAIFNQNKSKADESIDTKNGIVFTTYSTLRSAAVTPKAAEGEKPKAAPTRMEQLVGWLGKEFDGVIAFDEAHNAGNAIALKGDRGFSEPSAQALAVVELQKLLPNARIVYVSATGATEVSNLSFATRLGMWGDGTPFPTVDNFVAEMNAGGLATMELVARDMKQMGAYIARSLSFNGVTYGRVEHVLNPLQRDIYNRLAEGWQVTLRSMNEALGITGAVAENGKTLNTNAKRNMKSAYWGAQQRFFNQIITSMQMPSVIEDIRAKLKRGDAIVLQLVNTNEAQQERSLAKRKDDDEAATLEDLDLTPRDQLIQMVQKAYPVTQYEEKVDEQGRKYSEAAKDSQGNPVQNKEAVAMRDALIADLEQIRVPDGPLELILNAFGPDVVAEVTGRKQRVVRKKDKTGDITAQLESRGASAARADADAFMADKKRIMVFSDAGGTGYSFQADLTKKNQRKRSHYLIQPGWRANKAVQGLGRTHRTNQKSAPEYQLASTDIPAHKRFLSSIARRLDQLGALTKGQRDTSSGGLFSEKDNLESKYATQAVKRLLNDARSGQIAGVSFTELLHQLGLEDIVDKETGTIPEAKYPPTRQFLNRLLSLTLDMQESVFGAFISRMEEQVEHAAAMGTLDTGVQTIRALESRVVRRETVYTDKRTGAETQYVELELVQPTRMYDFPRAYKGEKVEYLRNRKSGRVWVKATSGTSTNERTGAVEDRFRMQGTNGMQIKMARDFAEKNGESPYETITEDQARDLWGDETAKRPKTYTERQHMVVGALLPIWDRLNNGGTMQVVRTQTSDGQRLLGRMIPESALEETMSKLQIASEESKLTPAEVMRRVLGGETGELANGWRLEPVTVSGDKRIEVTRTYGGAPELSQHGAIEERIGWKYRYFVPTGAKGEALLEYLFESKPLAKIGKVDSDGQIARKRGGGQDVQAGADTARTIFNPDRISPQRRVDIDKPHFQNAKMAAQWLAKNAENEWARAAAAQIARVLEADIDVKYLRVGQRYSLPSSVASLMRGGTFGVSSVDTDTGRGTIYMKADPNAPVGEEDLLHELIHQATQRALQVSASAPMRSEMAGLIRNLTGALKSAASDENNTQAFRDAALFFGSKIDSPDELLAYGLSSRTFRELAQRIRSDGRWLSAADLYADLGVERESEAGEEPVMTLWQKFVDVVRRLLGMAPKYQQQLERLLARREADRLKFIEKNATPTIMRKLDDLFSEALRIQRATSAEEYARQRSLSGPSVRAGTDRMFAGIRSFDQKAARNLFLDLTNTDSTLGFWSKSVGTQYAKARRFPETFGRVFDAVQDYIKDINNFANSAADQASTWLPKLEHYTDLKKGPPDAKDLAKVGPAIWQGTLNDKKVYLDSELRAMGLNGTQIGLYREFRAAIDQSLDDLVRTEIVRLASNSGAGAEAAVMSANTLTQSARAMNEYLTKRAEVMKQPELLDTVALINQKVERANQLKNEGYAPLMRFGRHRLHITNKEGETLYFGMYESNREANAAARSLQDDPQFAGARFQRGQMSQEAYRLFNGVSIDALELFADATGNADNKVYQDYLKLTKNNRSALKRMIHRKGIAGFNEDATRVLASFITSNARAASSNLNLGRAKAAAERIPKELGDLQDDAVKLITYVQDPQEEAPAIRGLLFTNFIGGSVASAVVNLTQPVTMTVPYLSQFGSVTKAASHVLSAAKALRGKLDGELAEAMARAERDGIVSPQEIHHLQAEAGGRLSNNPFLRKAGFIWGSMFSLAEQFNRRVTFVAAYNTAKEAHNPDPFAFAERAVIETQGLYNRGNKANWARGPIGAVALTFKQFSVHYLEFLHRMWTEGGPEGKKAVGVALAIMVLVAGAGGVPFADDLDDLIDTLAQAMGYDFSSKRAKRRFVAETLGLGQGVAEVATRGLSALPGFPLDVSLRMGMGNLIPGTGALLRSNTDRSRDVLEFAGAAGALAKAGMEAGGKVLSGEPGAAMLAVAPKAIQDMARAAQMFNTGEYRNTRDQKVTNADAIDVAMKFVGFQPAEIARESALMSEVQRSVQFAKNVEGEIAQKWAQGINDSDGAKIQDARAELRQWNEDNPESPMRISTAQVLRRVKEMRLTRAERAVQAAPRELRGLVRETMP